LALGHRKKLLKHKGRREPRKFGNRWINAFKIENRLSDILEALCTITV